MNNKQSLLERLHAESKDVREAIAFYVGFAVTPHECSMEDRERHYATLEQAGYLAKVEIHHG
jgi:ribosomal protein S17E